jgi:hypothetical protein
MKLKYLLVILLFASACKSASSVGSVPTENEKEGVSSVDPASFAKDEASQPGNITPNMVMDDSLRKNGFPVSQEKVTNLSAQSMVIHATVSSSVYKLFTRVHEQVTMSALAMTTLNRDYWKISNLEFKLSELSITHGDGTIETTPLGADGAKFNLVAGETATIAWIARIPVDTQICPFYSSIYIPSNMCYSVQLNWNFAGESLQGTLTHSIEAILQNPDGTTTSLPLVTDLPSAIDEASSDWAPRSDDRDFGCNGIMQSMN